MKFIFFCLLIAVIGNNNVNSQTGTKSPNISNSKVNDSLFAKEVLKLGFPNIFLKEQNCKITFSVVITNEETTCTPFFRFIDQSQDAPDFNNWKSYVSSLVKSCKEKKLRSGNYIVSLFRIDGDYFDRENVIPLSWNNELIESAHFTIPSTNPELVYLKPFYFFTFGRIE